MAFGADVPSKHGGALSATAAASGGGYGGSAAGGAGSEVANEMAEAAARSGAGWAAGSVGRSASDVSSGSSGVGISSAGEALVPVTSGESVIDRLMWLVSKPQLYGKGSLGFGTMNKTVAADAELMRTITRDLSDDSLKKLPKEELFAAIKRAVKTQYPEPKSLPKLDTCPIERFRVLFLRDAEYEILQDDILYDLIQELIRARSINKLNLLANFICYYEYKSSNIDFLSFLFTGIPFLDSSRISADMDALIFFVDFVLKNGSIKVSQLDPVLSLLFVHPTLLAVRNRSYLNRLITLITAWPRDEGEKEKLRQRVLFLIVQVIVDFKAPSGAFPKSCEYEDYTAVHLLKLSLVIASPFSKVVQDDKTFFELLAAGFVSRGALSQYAGIFSCYTVLRAYIFNTLKEVGVHDDYAPDDSYLNLRYWKQRGSDIYSFSSVEWMIFVISELITDDPEMMGKRKDLLPIIIKVFALLINNFSHCCDSPSSEDTVLPYWNSMQLRILNVGSLESVRLIKEIQAKKFSGKKLPLWPLFYAVNLGRSDAVLRELLDRGNLASYPDGLQLSEGSLAGPIGVQTMFEYVKRDFADCRIGDTLLDYAFMVGSLDIYNYLIYLGVPYSFARVERYLQDKLRGLTQVAAERREQAVIDRVQKKLDRLRELRDYSVMVPSAPPADAATAIATAELGPVAVVTAATGADRGEGDPTPPPVSAGLIVGATDRGEEGVVAHGEENPLSLPPVVLQVQVGLAAAELDSAPATTALVLSAPISVPMPVAAAKPDSAPASTALVLSAPVLALAPTSVSMPVAAAAMLPGSSVETVSVSDSISAHLALDLVTELAIAYPASRESANAQALVLIVRMGQYLRNVETRESQAASIYMAITGESTPPRLGTRKCAVFLSQLNEFHTNKPAVAVLQALTVHGLRMIDELEKDKKLLIEAERAIADDEVTFQVSEERLRVAFASFASEARGASASRC